jgi:hypothetical protein
MTVTLTDQDNGEMVAIEHALIAGDLQALTSTQRVAYYRRVCESLGLNELTKPFGYILLNGKLTLYALKGATDQLRRVQGVTLTRVTTELLGDVYVVTAHARTPDGREDQDIGAVSVKGLAGEALANAYMRAITKAKRRVTLSICGLGWLDETEVDTIPGARILPEELGAAVTVTPDGEVVMAPVQPTDDAPPTVTSSVVYPPREEPDPELEAARAALKAARSAHDWSLQRLVETASWVWPHITSAADLGTLTVVQLTRLTEVVTGESVIHLDTHGTRRIMPAEVLGVAS